MIATTCTHPWRVCHACARAAAPPSSAQLARAALRTALTLGALLTVACAPKAGWERDTARVCDVASAAVICVQASPDRAVEFDIGGQSVLPAECARAPEGGGAVRVAWSIAGGPWNDRRVRAPRHRRTELALGADATLEVMARHRCGPSMAPLVPLQ